MDELFELARYLSAFDGFSFIYEPTIVETFKSKVMSTREPSPGFGRVTVLYADTQRTFDVRDWDVSEAVGYLKQLKDDAR